MPYLSLFLYIHDEDDDTHSDARPRRFPLEFHTPPIPQVETATSATLCGVTTDGGLVTCPEMCVPSRFPACTYPFPNSTVGRTGKEARHDQSMSSQLRQRRGRVNAPPPPASADGFHSAGMNVSSQRSANREDQPHPAAGNSHLHSASNASTSGDRGQPQGLRVLSYNISMLPAFVGYAHGHGYKEERLAQFIHRCRTDYDVVLLQEVYTSPFLVVPLLKRLFCLQHRLISELRTPPPSTHPVTTAAERKKSSTAARDGDDGDGNGLDGNGGVEGNGGVDGNGGDKDYFPYVVVSRWPSILQWGAEPDVSASEAPQPQPSPPPRSVRGGGGGGSSRLAVKEGFRRMAQRFVAPDAGLVILSKFPIVAQHASFIFRSGREESDSAGPSARLCVAPKGCVYACVDVPRGGGATTTTRYHCFSAHLHHHHGMMTTGTGGDGPLTPQPSSATAATRKLEVDDGSTRGKQKGVVEPWGDHETRREQAQELRAFMVSCINSTICKATVQTESLSSAQRPRSYTDNVTQSQEGSCWPDVVVLGADLNTTLQPVGTTTAHGDHQSSAASAVVYDVDDLFQHLDPQHSLFDVLRSHYGRHVSTRPLAPASFLTSTSFDAPPGQGFLVAPASSPRRELNGVSATSSPGTPAAVPPLLVNGGSRCDYLLVGQAAQFIAGAAASAIPPLRPLPSYVTDVTLQKFIASVPRPRPYQYLSSHYGIVCRVAPPPPPSFPTVAVTSATSAGAAPRKTGRQMEVAPLLSATGRGMSGGGPSAALRRLASWLRVDRLSQQRLVITALVYSASFFRQDRFRRAPSAYYALDIVVVLFSLYYFVPGLVLLALMAFLWITFRRLGRREVPDVRFGRVTPEALDGLEPVMPSPENSDGEELPHRGDKGTSDDNKERVLRLSTNANSSSGGALASLPRRALSDRGDAGLLIRLPDSYTSLSLAILAPFYQQVARRPSRPCLGCVFTGDATSDRLEWLSHRDVWVLARALALGWQALIHLTARLQSLSAPSLQEEGEEEGALAAAGDAGGGGRFTQLNAVATAGLDHHHVRRFVAVAFGDPNGDVLRPIVDLAAIMIAASMTTATTGGGGGVTTVGSPPPPLLNDGEVDDPQAKGGHQPEPVDGEPDGTREDGSKQNAAVGRERNLRGEVRGAVGPSWGFGGLITLCGDAPSSLKAQLDVFQTPDGKTTVDAAMISDSRLEASPVSTWCPSAATTLVVLPSPSREAMNDLRSIAAAAVVLPVVPENAKGNESHHEEGEGKEEDSLPYFPEAPTGEHICAVMTRLCGGRGGGRMLPASPMMPPSSMVACFATALGLSSDLSPSPSAGSPTTATNASEGGGGSDYAPSSSPQPRRQAAGAGGSANGGGSSPSTDTTGRHVVFLKDLLEFGRLLDTSAASCEGGSSATASRLSWRSEAAEQTTVWFVPMDAESSRIAADTAHVDGPPSAPASSPKLSSATSSVVQLGAATAAFVSQNVAHVGATHLLRHEVDEPSGGGEAFSSVTGWLSRKPKSGEEDGGVTLLSHADPGSLLFQRCLDLAAMVRGIRVSLIPSNGGGASASSWLPSATVNSGGNTAATTAAFIAALQRCRPQLLCTTRLGLQAMDLIVAHYIEREGYPTWLWWFLRAKYLRSGLRRDGRDAFALRWIFFRHCQRLLGGTSLRSVIVQSNEALPFRLRDDVGVYASSLIRHVVFVAVPGQSLAPPVSSSASSDAPRQRPPLTSVFNLCGGFIAIDGTPPPFVLIADRNATMRHDGNGDSAAGCAAAALPSSSSEEEDDSVLDGRKVFSPLWIHDTCWCCAGVDGQTRKIAAPTRSPRRTESDKWSKRGTWPAALLRATGLLGRWNRTSRQLEVFGPSAAVAFPPRVGPTSSSTWRLKTSSPLPPLRLCTVAPPVLCASMERHLRMALPGLIADIFIFNAAPGAPLVAVVVAQREALAERIEIDRARKYYGSSSASTSSSSLSLAGASPSFEWSELCALGEPLLTEECARVLSAKRNDLCLPQPYSSRNNARTYYDDKVRPAKPLFSSSPPLSGTAGSLSPAANYEHHHPSVASGGAGAVPDAGRLLYAVLLHPIPFPQHKDFFDVFGSFDRHRMKRYFHDAARRCVRRKAAHEAGTTWMADSDDDDDDEDDDAVEGSTKRTTEAAAAGNAASAACRSQAENGRDVEGSAVMDSMESSTSVGATASSTGGPPSSLALPLADGGPPMTCGGNSGGGCFEVVSPVAVDIGGTCAKMVIAWLPPPPSGSSGGQRLGGAASPDPLAMLPSYVTVDQGFPSLRVVLRRAPVGLSGSSNDVSPLPPPSASATPSMSSTPNAATPTLPQPGVGSSSMLHFPVEHTSSSLGGGGGNDNQPQPPPPSSRPVRLRFLKCPTAKVPSFLQFVRDTQLHRAMSQAFSGMFPSATTTVPSAPTLGGPSLLLLPVGSSSSSAVPLPQSRSNGSTPVSASANAVTKPRGGQTQQQTAGTATPPVMPPERPTVAHHHHFPRGGGGSGQPTASNNNIIPATGGGAFKFNSLSREQLGIGFMVKKEMDCLIQGILVMLKHGGPPQASDAAAPLFACDTTTGEATRSRLPPWPSAAATPGSGPPPSTAGGGGLFPFLVVNIGSGVSMVRCDDVKGSYVRVGGSPIGGATFWGLVRALTGVRTWEEIADMTRIDGPGDNTAVDLLVGDIYGYSATELPARLTVDTVASCLGKLGTGRSTYRTNNSREEGTGSHQSVVQPLIMGASGGTVGGSASANPTTAATMVDHLAASDGLGRSRRVVGASDFGELPLSWRDDGDDHAATTAAPAARESTTAASAARRGETGTRHRRHSTNGRWSSSSSSEAERTSSSSESSSSTEEHTSESEKDDDTPTDGGRRGHKITSSRDGKGQPLRERAASSSWTSSLAEGTTDSGSSRRSRGHPSQRVDPKQPKPPPHHHHHLLPHRAATVGQASSQDVQPVDLVRSLLIMTASNVTQLAYLTAQKERVENIIFTGGFVRDNALVRRQVSRSLQYWSAGSMTAHFVKIDGYLGALGAMSSAGDVGRVLAT
mgnify:CR=1 FL=1